MYYVDLRGRRELEGGPADFALTSVSSDALPSPIAACHTSLDHGTDKCHFYTGCDRLNVRTVDIYEKTFGAQERLLVDEESRN